MWSGLYFFFLSHSYLAHLHTFYADIDTRHADIDTSRADIDTCHADINTWAVNGIDLFCQYRLQIGCHQTDKYNFCGTLFVSLFIKIKKTGKLGLI